MIRALSYFFIRDRFNYTDSKVRKNYGTLTGIVGIFLNVILFIGKFIAGTVTGAISITADAFNNLSDAGSSLISLIGFQLADKKPDPEHPFGHGRMEYVTGLFVSILIIIMGFELGKSSITKIIHPEAVDSSIISIVILAAAILVKIYMHMYNRFYSKKINSASLKATSLDSLSDSVATTVVLISVLVSKATNINIDGYTGVIVSCFILFTGVKSIKETIGPLLGEAPDPALVQSIYDIVHAHKEIVGVHDMVIHDYGPGRCMVSLHGEVSEDGNINDLHDVIDVCEREINEKLGFEAVIHMDPVSVNNEDVELHKAKVKELIKAYDPTITIHDFRMVVGPTHTNIIFDAVLPMESKKSSEEVLVKMNEIVRSLDGNCLGVIKIDRQYAKWQSQES